MSNVIHPPTKTVTVGGQEITVREITLGQITPVTKALLPVLGTLLAPDGSINLIALAMHSDCLVDALVVCDLGTHESISALPGNEAMDLLTAWVEINSDFFTIRILPVVQLLHRQMAARWAGQEQSSDLKAVDGDIPKS